MCAGAKIAMRVADIRRPSAYVTCTTSRLYCELLYYQQTPGPYAFHARKNARFTMKLSATCHAALGRCGESRRSNTLTVTVRFL